MNKSGNREKRAEKEKSHIFGLLKPYKGMILLLVLLAFLGNGVNLLIPKIISHGIDAYTGGHYVFST